MIAMPVTTVAQTFTLTGTIDTKLTLRGDMPAGLLWALQRLFTIDNPEFIEAQKYDRSTDEIYPTLAYFRTLTDGGLEVPRGALLQVYNLCRAYAVTPVWDDRTHVGPAVTFAKHVSLSAAQEQAVQKALGQRMATLVAPAGGGKTRMAMGVIEARQQPALILVHTRELQQQAARTAQDVLGLSADEIGLIGGGQCSIGDRLTVALVQTLAQGVPDELRGHASILVLDEAHHCPAETFVNVVKQFPARYLLGLTATPERRDGLGHVMEWYLGPIVARIDRADLRDRLIKPTIIKRETGIHGWGETFTALVSDLVTDQKRNTLIINDVVAAVGQGRQCLVLSERVDHVDELTRRLQEKGIAAAALHGQQKKRVRDEVVARMNAGELTAVVATSNLAGEGLDCPALSAAFLCCPVSWSGRTTQYIGRVSRTHPSKHSAIVVDYLDRHPITLASWKKRMAVYRAQGLEWRTVGPERASI